MVLSALKPPNANCVQAQIASEETLFVSVMQYPEGPYKIANIVHLVIIELVCLIVVQSRLKTHIFPSLHPDVISLVSCYF